MNSIVKVFSNFKEFYNEINGATLTGAIDVIAVEQPDGSYLCSPFHVRFGKLGVLRSREKIVDIEVNGEPVDIHMKLGESGEAFFVEECADDDLEVPAHMATSPIPNISFECNFEAALDANGVISNRAHKEEEDDPMPRPRRNSIDLSKENTEGELLKFENQRSDYSHRRHTDNVTNRPDLSLTKKEYTTQKLRQEWAAEQEQLFHAEALESASAADWANSTPVPKDAGEVPPAEEETHFKPIDAAQPTIAEITVAKVEPSVQTAIAPAQTVTVADDKSNQDSKSKKKRRKKSLMKKKNSQRKNSSSSSGGSNHSDPNDGAETDSMTASQVTASSNSGSPKDNDQELPVAGGNVGEEPSSKSLDQVVDPTPEPHHHELDIHFFSDTDVASGVSPRQSRPSTPIQSDTEFEISQREKTEHETSLPASWKWGELPTKQEGTEDVSTTQGKQAQRNSMISGLMSFMKYNKKMRKNVGEGLYLSDFDESLDPEVAALYFPQPALKGQSRQQEEDRESGNGTSVPQSPTSMEGIKSLDSDFDEHQSQKVDQKCSFDNIALSLCGGLDNPDGPSDEEFEKHQLEYSNVIANPAIFASPDLVVKIDGKFYSWTVACPQVMTMLAFRKPLPKDFYDGGSRDEEGGKKDHLLSKVDDQQQLEETKTQQPTDASRGGRWWYWRRSNENKAPMNAIPEPQQEQDHEQQLQLLPSDINSKTSVVATQTSRSGSPNDAVVPTMEPTGKAKDDEYNDSLSSEGSELCRSGPMDILNRQVSIVAEKYRKSLRLSTEQIESLNLQQGMNEIVFSVTTAYQGTSRCKCFLFKWKHNDKVVISDIDGTITKSDVLGHILPMVGKNWEQIGVAQLFSKIEENGYKMLYLSARAIGQAKTTRDYLQSIRQGDVKLPDGPLLLNPTSLMSAFHREVIEKKPEQFKIACLSDIQALFPERNPFYAGYGNRINDVWAYRAVGIPISRIFTINTKGELKHELTQTFQSTYANMAYIVDQLFPPIKHIDEEDIEYTSFNYWRDPVPDVDFHGDVSGSSSAPPSTNSSPLSSGKITPTATLVQQALPTIPEN